MAMVGLFWIAEGDVYVGAKPSGLAPGVRLSPDGVVALGDKQSGRFPWEDVRTLTVADVPVKTLKRQVGVATELALDTVVNMVMPTSPSRLGDAPAMLTIGVETREGDHELSAYAAAAVGYSPAELDLSRALLSRLTKGRQEAATTLAAMAEWGRTWEGGSPGGTERESLLRKWVG
ncbi:hypothetical protein FM076_31625 [Streptomyces albus subsp. chlorinus]|uniref:hypothetical protein n=1 Tax=Streptomyces albus TaxID=1888 RepID=UPI001570BE1D|nr:hypothetical protein [Streptomyces albus]NSC25458.1 hypothetical protein [Streptomyces albus subsp. chlorinus]